MAFAGKNPFKILREILFEGGVDIGVTLAGNATITHQTAQVRFVDPAGNRDYTMPAAKAGYWHLVVNTADAAETITVKDAAGNTIVAVAQDRAGLVATDGTTWDGCAFTISL